jgi:hypothetical protein
MARASRPEQRRRAGVEFDKGPRQTIPYRDRLAGDHGGAAPADSKYEDGQGSQLDGASLRSHEASFLGTGGSSNVQAGRRTLSEQGCDKCISARAIDYQNALHPRVRILCSFPRNG